MTKKINLNCPKGGRRITNLIRKSKNEGYDQIQFLDTLIIFDDPESKKGTKPVEQETPAPNRTLYAIKVEKKGVPLGFFESICHPLSSRPYYHTEWYIKTAMNEVISFFQQKGCEIYVNSTMV